MRTLKQALSSWLEARGHAVITDYNLTRILVEFYRDKTYQDEQISLRKNIPEQRDCNRAVRGLLEDNIITPDRDLSSFAYRIVKVPDESAEAILCDVDPFLYVSHLSAMQRHGLTNRNPTALVLSRPMPGLWRKLATEKIAGDFQETTLEQLQIYMPRFALPSVVRERTLQVHDLKSPGSWQVARDSSLRIATIGQTFADMLSRPQWCGGMSHVLQVWENHIETVGVFRDEIIEAIQNATANIVRVRAGYILDERFGFRDARIEAWTVHAQRGGSRLLDPTKEYRPVYSEKWMISINAEPEQTN